MQPHWLILYITQKGTSAMNNLQSKLSLIWLPPGMQGTNRPPAVFWKYRDEAMESRLLHRVHTLLKESPTTLEENPEGGRTRHQVLRESLTTALQQWILTTRALSHISSHCDCWFQLVLPWAAGSKLSRVWVTVDRIRIGNLMYWPLIDRNCKNCSAMANSNTQQFTPARAKSS
jgi:hypothetical protein